ncbi:two-component sensor histidine kinase [Eisenbergiella tayi]|uniref:histidine kinase n=1 Tax=Eisenbergiella tayi TaxID=1432052 RepID=A0A1E3AQB7_9FIRM|nr:HAMP domain-containing sensor histidine kinase [Eisenbergiella tayi]ODM10898.1 Sensor histidine kinase YycG [Eisenbergiella tayi]OIZ62528.1 two-component sensor histidine kinase [Eisenbergiella tayi]
MKLRNWCRDNFGMHTIRKRVFFLSKLAGGTIVLFYLFTSVLPVGQDAAFLIWFLLMLGVILLVDYLLGRFITRPVDELNEAAGRMAGLDFSRPCELKSTDEFGMLSQNLNTMADNLENALSRLEAINGRLETEVEREKRRVAERKELADNLSHEMKTPLGVIRAYAEGLQDTGEEEKRKQYAQVIIGETERMNRMITSLLELSAMDAGAVQLAPVLFGFVEFTETEAGRLLMDLPWKEFELEYRLPAMEYQVCADKGKMEQVLDNLIGNARKYVSPGGILRITLEKEEGFLRFGVYNEGDCIREEDLPRVWDKFYRVGGRSTEGAGLGLAIAAGILELHGWKYGVRNREKGVEFYFFAPIED